MLRVWTKRGEWNGGGAIAPRLQAFTLIELLVVITILGVLAALIFPALGSARDAGQAATCASRMRQLGLAVNLYADDQQDYFPRSQHSAFAHRQQPWEYVLAPYFGCPITTWSTLLQSAYHCPSDARSRSFSFGLNVYFELDQGDDYEGAVEGLTWHRRRDVLRPVGTILFAENASEADHLMPNFWGAASEAADLASERHRRSAHYGFVDGHIERRELSTLFDPARRLDQWHPGLAH